MTYTIEQLPKWVQDKIRHRQATIHNIFPASIVIPLTGTIRIRFVGLNSRSKSLWQLYSEIGQKITLANLT